MIIVIIVEDIRKIELSKMDGSCSQQSYFGFHRTQQHFRWRGRKICHLKTIRCHSFPTCTSKYNQKFFASFSGKTAADIQVIARFSANPQEA